MIGKRSPRRRILYFAPVYAEIGDNAIGSAARNKVLGVCSALAMVGAQPIVVAVAPPSRPRQVTSRRDGTLFVETKAYGRGPLRRVTALVGQALAGLRIARQGDDVILYNFFPEYLLLALLLKLRGTPATLDIEDGPANTSWPLNRFLNRLFYKLMIPLVTRGKLVVAHSLALRLGIDRYLAVYGVRAHKTSQVRFTGERVRINFGGTIEQATGLDLFRETLKWLAIKAPTTPLSFFITGQLPSGALDAVRSIVQATSGLRLEVQTDLDLVRYKALLDTCDVGLSLRLPSSEMAETTFPSKVIEIAGDGLLLVTTRVSDVPLMFDDTTAVLLADASPQALGQALIGIAQDRAAAAERAVRGAERIRERFSPGIVGAAVIDFLSLEFPKAR